MKESYIEGLANHSDPESGAGGRKVAGEAMAGVRAGGVLSRENFVPRVPTDVVKVCGRQHRHARYGKGMSGPARSETSSMLGNSMRENRESLRSFSGNGREERAGKNELQEPAMNGHRQSDSPIVPAKLLNKVRGAQGTAEVVEGRGLTKGKAVQQNTSWTQCLENDVPNGLHRIRQAAIRNKGERCCVLCSPLSLSSCCRPLPCVSLKYPKSQSRCTPFSTSYLLDHLF